LILAAGFNKSFDVCKMVEILVEAGADVNARNEKGLSPLMLLVKNSYNYDLMKLLVKAGADLHAKCKNGKTVLEYSKENEVQLMTSAVSHFFKE
jgi:ankyrin repeat protein